MVEWMVALTQPQSWRLALLHLERQGFAPYAPRIRTITAKGGMKKTIEQPMFGRYIFIQLHSGWRAVTGTRGIAQLLMWEEDRPAIISDRVINEIKSREDKKGCVTVSKIKKGQRVTIQSGSLIGQIGVYNGLSASGREAVLLNLLGRVVPVSLAASDSLALCAE